MKKIILFIFILGFTPLLFGQNNDLSSISKCNVLKFLPVNLYFHTVSFEYERMINPRNSITFQVGLPITKSVMGKYGITANSDLKRAEFGTSTLRGAFRHYTGRQMLPKGFYFEPYLNYHQIRGDARIAGLYDQGIEYAGASAIKLNSVNIGCQFGFQFLIAKRVSLDLYLLGFEGGFLRGDIITKSAMADPYDPLILTVIKQVIDQNISELPSPISNKLSVYQIDNGIVIKATNAPYPWFRGGISIGFAF
jgi:hypothetical protein